MTEGVFEYYANGKSGSHWGTVAYFAKEEGIVEIDADRRGYGDRLIQKDLQSTAGDIEETGLGGDGWIGEEGEFNLAVGRQSRFRALVHWSAHHNTYRRNNDIILGKR
jgi:hypothetical protein